VLATVLVPAAVLSAGFGGLPPTGGYLAKLAVKDQLGYGLPGSLSVLSAVGSTLLMLHFARRLAAQVPAEAKAGPDRRMLLPWLLTAAGSVLLPWSVLLAGGGGAVRDALAPAALWAALWPVLVGAALALVQARFFQHLPRVPEGDLVVFGERAARRIARLSVPVERTEKALRHWPAAGTAMLVMIVLLGAAMLASVP
jgi:hypothetical protein